MNTLGLKLLDLRQQHNLTQKQLCKELNIGRSTYSYFETGTRTPDIETLMLSAEYYDVSLDKFLNRFRELSKDQQDELIYLTNYKLRHTKI